MKYITWLATLFFSSLSIAGVNDYACLHLYVRIKNNTQQTCYLLIEELTNGSMLNVPHDVTFKILPNTTSPFVDVVSSNFSAGASLELVYECGEGSYIRLNSEKNACGRNNTVHTSTLYAANLNATAQKTEANYWKNKPAEIVWTINA